MKSLSRKFRVYINRRVKSKWSYTDTILHIKDIIDVPGIYPENVTPVDVGRDFICLKDFKNTNIFISKNRIDSFINDKRFYNKKKGWVNLSNVKKFISKKNTIAYIINSAPKEIEIRRTMVCTVRDSDQIPYNVYFIAKIDIDKSDDIFNELLNLQIMKEKFSLK